MTAQRLHRNANPTCANFKNDCWQQLPHNSCTRTALRLCLRFLKMRKHLTMVCKRLRTSCILRYSVCPERVALCLKGPLQQCSTVVPVVHSLWQQSCPSHCALIPSAQISRMSRLSTLPFVKLNINRSLPPSSFKERARAWSCACRQSCCKLPIYLSGTNNSAVSSNYAAITKHWHHPFLI